MNDQEGSESSSSSSSSSSDGVVASTTTRPSLVQLSSEIFPQTMYRPRLIPRNNNNFSRKYAGDTNTIEDQFTKHHLLVDFNGNCCSSSSTETSTTTTTTTTTADNIIEGTNNKNNYYFSPLLVGQEEDDDEDYYLVVQSNNDNNSRRHDLTLDSITLQYWKESSHMQSFDLLGVISSDDQDPSSTTTSNNSNSAGSTSSTFNMVNMLLTSPLDAADHYRYRAARMWEGYYSSVPNISTHSAPTENEEGSEAVALNTEQSTVGTSTHQSTPTITSSSSSSSTTHHQLPMALLEKLEDKSTLIKNFVLMEQHREMKKFLENNQVLLNGFVSRGEELQKKGQQQQQQQQRVLLYPTSATASYNSPQENKTNNTCTYDDKNNDTTTFCEVDNNSINSNLGHLGEGKRPKDYLTNLQVPNIFFNPDFSLSDPVAFTSISTLLLSTESNDSSSNSNTPYHSFSDQATSPIHLYWDVVDESLREQVICKSEDFFLENATFRDLEILIAQADDDIISLRQEFYNLKSSLDEEDDVLHMAHQRIYLQQLDIALENVSNIVNSKRLVENTLLTRTTETDYEGAYNLASTVIEDIDMQRSLGFCSSMENNGCYRLVDLIGVADVRKQLCQYQAFSVDQAVSLLVEIFISWEFNGYEAVNLSTRSTIKNLTSFLSSIHQLSLVNQRYIYR
jgi:hypothetical protein